MVLKDWRFLMRFAAREGNDSHCQDAGCGISGSKKANSKAMSDSEKTPNSKTANSHIAYSSLNSAASAFSRLDVRNQTIQPINDTHKIQIR